MPRKFAILLLMMTTLLVVGRAAAASTISFYVFGDDAEKAVYESLVAAFNQQYPDITVNMVYTPGEDEMHGEGQEDAYRQRLSLDFAAGKAPDVFIMNYREYGIFAERGAIEPVVPYLEKSTVIHADDLYPQVLPPFTLDGVLQCIPASASGTVVYYNKALFDAAKLDYPQAGWTWDDFLKDAQALTVVGADNKTTQYGVGIDPSFNRLLPFIWQNGGDVVKDADATTLTLDSAETTAAFQWFVDLQGKYKVTPDELQLRSRSVQERFEAGTLGMILFSRRLTPTLREASFDWDVAPLPTGQQSATLLYSDGYCMTKTNAADAWKLIEFANSPAGQTLLAHSGLIVPSLKAVAESPAFLDPSAKPANSQLFLDILPDARITPQIPGYADLEEAVNQQVEAAFFGDITVEQAIERLGEELPKETD